MFGIHVPPLAMHDFDMTLISLSLTQINKSLEMHSSKQNRTQQYVISWARVHYHRVPVLHIKRNLKGNIQYRDTVGSASLASHFCVCVKVPAMKALAELPAWSVPGFWFIEHTEGTKCLYVSVALEWGWILNREWVYSRDLIGVSLCFSSRSNISWPFSCKRMADETARASQKKQSEILKHPVLLLRFRIKIEYRSISQIKLQMHEVDVHFIKETWSLPTNFEGMMLVADSIDLDPKYLFFILLSILSPSYHLKYRFGMTHGWVNNSYIIPVQIL